MWQRGSATVPRRASAASIGRRPSCRSTWRTRSSILRRPGRESWPGPPWSTGWPPHGTSPVISVVAPPGYGKTTLLAQWAERTQPRVGWVSADDHDNDPAVLLTYIAVALDRIEAIDPTVFRSLTSSGAGIKGPRRLGVGDGRDGATGLPRHRSSRGGDEPGESRRDRRAGARTAGGFAARHRFAGRVAAAGGAPAFAGRHRGDRGRRSGDGTATRRLRC